MVSIGDTVGGLFSFSGTWGIIGTVMLILLIVLLFLGGGAGLVVLYIYRKTWTEKAEIYKTIGGKVVRIRIDKARYKRIGRVGDRIFFIAGKTKRHLACPRYMVSPNVWAFYERKDGELINFQFENLDEKIDKMGVHLLHEDVRMQRLGIEKNLGDNFKKLKFWEKYGSLIMNAIYVMFVTISLVILFAKLVDVAGAIKEMAKQVGQIAQSLKPLVEQSTGTRPYEVNGTTGLVPAFICLLWRKSKWKKKT